MSGRDKYALAFYMYGNKSRKLIICNKDIVNKPDRGYLLVFDCKL